MFNGKLRVTVPKRSIVTTVITAVFIAFLTACGGGGAAPMPSQAQTVGPEAFANGQFVELVVDSFPNAAPFAKGQTRHANAQSFMMLPRPGQNGQVVMGREETTLQGYSHWGATILGFNANFMPSGTQSGIGWAVGWNEAMCGEKGDFSIKYGAEPDALADHLAARFTAPQFGGHVERRGRGLRAIIGGVFGGLLINALVGAAAVDPTGSFTTRDHVFAACDGTVPGPGPGPADLTLSVSKSWNGSICFGEDVTLTASSNLSGTTYTHSLSYGTANLSSTSGASVTVTAASQAGVVKILTTAKNGSQTATFTTAINVVDCSITPTGDLSATISPSSGPPGTQITITVTSTDCPYTIYRPDGSVLATGEADGTRTYTTTAPTATATTTVKWLVMGECGDEVELPFTVIVNGSNPEDLCFQVVGGDNIPNPGPASVTLRICEGSEIAGKYYQWNLLSFPQAGTAPEITKVNESGTEADFYYDAPGDYVIRLEEYASRDAWLANPGQWERSFTKTVHTGP